MSLRHQMRRPRPGRQHNMERAKTVSSKRHHLEGVSHPRRNSLKPEQLPIETLRGSRSVSRRAHEHRDRGIASPREHCAPTPAGKFCRRKNDRNSTTEMLLRESGGARARRR